MEDDDETGEREVTNRELDGLAVLGAPKGNGSPYNRPKVKGAAEGVDATGGDGDGRTGSPHGLDRWSWSSGSLEATREASTFGEWWHSHGGL
ncbi:hypothetical protein E2562_016496 [Oryza meyeriana var. granulata]|uniref:DUF834 domain-containing protein n=1 Tax=Oryza meyeriana var. granulata TaxID=110450 RepID=A0A6G1BL99_9ORYZ|nr:hypothetical protein E2562_016496 [Oryza meyeriana var. granulata]